VRRRRMRRYRPGKENSVMKFLLILGIILGAVVCGYLTARFALGPLLGYDTEVLKLDFPSKLTAQLSDKGDETDDKEAEKGYVLQFGVFSSQSGAETLQNQLKLNGIETVIEAEQSSYKVVSQVIETKEDALEQLGILKKKHSIDVFIDAVD